MYKNEQICSMLFDYRFLTHLKDKWRELKCKLEMCVYFMKTINMCNIIYLHNISKLAYILSKLRSLRHSRQLTIQNTVLFNNWCWRFYAEPHMCWREVVDLMANWFHGATNTIRRPIRPTHSTDKLREQQYAQQGRHGFWKLIKSKWKGFRITDPD